jgi:hypothetical protein
MPDCPQCDEPLKRLSGQQATTPPWLSAACGRLWWQAELAASARGAWDRSLRSYAPGYAESILLAAANERAEVRR